MLQLPEKNIKDDKSIMKQRRGSHEKMASSNSGQYATYAKWSHNNLHDIDMTLSLMKLCHVTISKESFVSGLIIQEHQQTCMSRKKLINVPCVVNQQCHYHWY